MHFGEGGPGIILPTYASAFILPVNSKEIASSTSHLFFLLFCLLNILPECFYSVFLMVVSLGYWAADIFVKLMSQRKNQWRTGIRLQRGERYNLCLIVCKYSSLAGGLSDSLAERERRAMQAAFSNHAGSYSW